MDKTVTLSDAEWQWLVATVAGATGYMTFNKLVTQLQAQDLNRVMQTVPGNGLDREGEQQSPRPD